MPFQPELPAADNLTVGVQIEMLFTMQILRETSKKILW
jgi:hypothetical protein